MEKLQLNSSMYLATNLRIYVLLHVKDKDEDAKGHNESEHTEAKYNNGISCGRRFLPPRLAAAVSCSQSEKSGIIRRRKRRLLQRRHLLRPPRLTAAASLAAAAASLAAAWRQHLLRQRQDAAAARRGGGKTRRRQDAAAARVAASCGGGISCGRLFLPPLLAAASCGRHVSCGGGVSCGSGKTRGGKMRRPKDAAAARDAAAVSSSLFCLQENKYPLTSKPTGLCLIINNENFQDGTNRRGTEKDAGSLATVVSWLGFQVLMCMDKTASDMAQVTKLLADLKDLPGLQKCKPEEWSDGRSTPLSVLPQHGDAFVCCVLSHGAEKVVLGVDRKPLPISDITWAFNKEHCPALLGKPKMFFIQACQGHRLQTGLVMDDHPLECDAIDLGRPKVEDGLRVVSIPGEADILVAVATVEKFQVVRHRENGSWFIQSLCEQLREGCPRGEDIMLILRRVIDDVNKKEVLLTNGVSMKQTPEVKIWTLRHGLVFSPSSSWEYKTRVANVSSAH
ncbi:caspase-8-like [Gadus morhua]|uniref:caspase-8-like n=1 Tax=Gadus morhua TaxID=8049 RepID=UPI0011B74209|nr:caspase-8-like [Gadus morhua]